MVIFDEITLTYIAYSFFLFYVTKWMKDFQGSSKGAYLFLTYFSGLGTFFGLGMLFYIGYSISWLFALKIFGISMLSSFMLIPLETFITGKILRINYPIQAISMISFFVVPYCGYRLLVLT